MKVGIMQPYFLPYIGYWQLMNAVDKYVIYDDVQFIKGGWINRNRILLEGHPHYFNVHMIGASSNKKINEIRVNTDHNIMNKTMRIIEGAYRKAPYFEVIHPIIKEILQCKQDNLSKYIQNSFEIVCGYLGINTELICSSSLNKDCSLRGQEKVIAICELLGATEYYNAIGGQQLYSCSDFMEHGIRLKFLKTKYMGYRQFDNEFQKDLSILDVLMFNSKEEIQQMLKEFRLIENYVECRI